MSAVAQIGAAVGAVKMMASLKAAWTRAHGDGVRLWQVPSWLAYYGGRDPHAGKRCTDCKRVLTPKEQASRRVCCDPCWYARLAESQSHRTVGRIYEP